MPMAHSPDWRSKVSDLQTIAMLSGTWAFQNILDMESSVGDPHNPMGTSSYLRVSHLDKSA